MTEYKASTAPKSKLFKLFTKKKVTSFADLLDVYSVLFAERYFWNAAIKLGYYRTAGMSDAEKVNILKEYRQKLEKGEVKDVKPGAQDCTFKHLSNAWKIDPRTMQDLKAWLKERGKYFIKEGPLPNGCEGPDQQQ